MKRATARSEDAAARDTRSLCAQNTVQEAHQPCGLTARDVSCTESTVSRRDDTLDVVAHHESSPPRIANSNVSRRHAVRSATPCDRPDSRPDGTRGIPGRTPTTFSGSPSAAPTGISDSAPAVGSCRRRSERNCVTIRRAIVGSAHGRSEEGEYLGACLAERWRPLHRRHRVGGPTRCRPERASWC